MSSVTNNEVQKAELASATDFIKTDLFRNVSKTQLKLSTHASSVTYFTPTDIVNGAIPHYIGCFRWMKEHKRREIDILLNDVPIDVYSSVLAELPSVVRRRFQNNGLSCWDRAGDSFKAGDKLEPWHAYFISTVKLDQYPTIMEYLQRGMLHRTVEIGGTSCQLFFQIRTIICCTS